MNIEENNKLIAEFMGGIVQIREEYIMDGSYPVYPHRFKEVEFINFDGSMVRVSYLNYNGSYDKLIPVMQRIYMTATSMPKEYYDVTHAFAINPIEDNYKIVVAFINWYNENK